MHFDCAFPCKKQPRPSDWDKQLPTVPHLEEGEILAILSAMSFTLTSASSEELCKLSTTTTLQLPVQDKQ